MAQDSDWLVSVMRRIVYGLTGGILLGAIGLSVHIFEPAWLSLPGVGGSAAVGALLGLVLGPRVLSPMAWILRFWY
jgi:hypothetical protein